MRGAKEVLLETPNFKLTQRLLKMSLLGNDRMEKSYIAIGKTFIGQVMPDTNEEIALQTAREWRDHEETAWMNGSRLDDGRVGCRIAWQESGDPENV
jgi:hypothetical protein